MSATVLAVRSDRDAREPGRPSDCPGYHGEAHDEMFGTRHMGNAGKVSLCRTVTVELAGTPKSLSWRYSPGAGAPSRDWNSFCLASSPYSARALAGS
jgi:hypothetical protein